MIIKCNAILAQDFSLDSNVVVVHTTIMLFFFYVNINAVD